MLQGGQLMLFQVNYTTRAGGDLLGLGVSAIGKVGSTYSQNLKALPQYYEAIEAGRFATERGYALTADDLMRLGVVDEVVGEPEGGAHRDHDLAAANLGVALRRNLKRALETPIADLLQQRYAKFRKLGNYAEGKHNGHA